MIDNETIPFYLEHIENTNFPYYLNTMNIDSNSDILILSPVHHYYYDFKELKNIKTIVHPKELNRVSNLHLFIHGLSTILGENAKTYWVFCG